MDETAGRAAQRRRTRRAILDAAARLLASGGEPTIAEVAAEAEVSRRTVYLHFPTLDQLLLDASLASLDFDVDAAIAAGGEEVPARVQALVDALAATVDASLPIGRRIVKLTVDAPASDTPRRGYRRTAWIEAALEPWRGRLGAGHFERLVSSLALVVGWEAFIVLFDVRGLDLASAREVVSDAARVLLEDAARDIAD
jgi:AcrR family transcriptional regulator